MPTSSAIRRVCLKQPNLEEYWSSCSLLKLKASRSSRLLPKIVKRNEQEACSSSLGTKTARLLGGVQLKVSIWKRDHKRSKNVADPTHSEQIVPKKLTDISTEIVSSCSVNRERLASPFVEPSVGPSVEPLNEAFSRAFGRAFRRTFSEAFMTPPWRTVWNSVVCLQTALPDPGIPLDASLPFRVKLNLIHK